MVGIFIPVNSRLRLVINANNSCGRNFKSNARLINVSHIKVGSSQAELSAPEVNVFVDSAASLRPDTHSEPRPAAGGRTGGTGIPAFVTSNTPGLARIVENDDRHGSDQFLFELSSCSMSAVIYCSTYHVSSPKNFRF